MFTVRQLIKRLEAQDPDLGVVISVDTDGPGTFGMDEEQDGVVEGRLFVLEINESDRVDVEPRDILAEMDDLDEPS